MAQTIDEFFSSPGQVSARRTSRILEILKDAAPNYNNVDPQGRLASAVEKLTDDHRKALQDWAESRDMRSVVNIQPGRADKIIDSGKFYTPHDKVAGAAWTGKGAVTEERLREMRAGAETRLGLPFYDSAIQDDPIKGLRPASGENLPKSFFDVQPNLMRQIHGQDVPIMHPYAYGSKLMEREVGFAGFARPQGGGSGGRYDRLILRSETAGRASIHPRDFLHDNTTSPAVSLSDISNPEKSIGIFGGGSSPESISDVTKVGAEDIMSYKFSPRDFAKFETLTLGVGMEDIEAIISHPEHIDVSSMPENLQKLSRANTIHGSSYDFGKMLHQSEQRIKASQYGIDYVQGTFDDVEFHNPHMTKSFMERRQSMFKGTGITASAGETPFEVYVKSIRHALETGGEADGLAGLADADRPFAIGEIDKHLEAYNKHKSFKFGATTDAVEGLNFGKMSDINRRNIPLAKSMAENERLAARIASQREILSKSFPPEKVEAIMLEQFSSREILSQRGFRGEALEAKVAQYGDSMENTAARVANRQVPQTVEEGVEVAVRRSGATRGLLEASTEASSHVASGTGGSRMLRTAGAALSILRKRF
jgi:hypothetical protein